MAETVVRIERNNCGIQIKKCCASCAFKVIKVINADCERRCSQTGQTVEGTDYCEQWQMAEGLKNLGLEEPWQEKGRCKRHRNKGGNT